MSITLIPPTFYVDKPTGRPVRVYTTVAGAAGAIRQLGPLPAAVGAVTGRRAWGLTESELNELERRIGARRLSPRRRLTTTAVDREWRGDR